MAGSQQPCISATHLAFDLKLFQAITLASAKSVHNDQVGSKANQTLAPPGRRLLHCLHGCALLASAAQGFACHQGSRHSEEAPVVVRTLKLTPMLQPASA